MGRVPVSAFSFDIETLGQRPYSVIIAVGVQAFDPRQRSLDAEDDGLYLVVSASDCTKVGARMDAETVIWWMQQSQEARKAFSPGGGGTVDYTLSRINDYLDNNGFTKQSTVWGNGSGFDINLLENLYELCGRQPPWRFWQSRDVRTAVDMGQVDKKAVTREGTHHNALDDARYQAQLVMEGFNAVLGRV